MSLSAADISYLNGLLDRRLKNRRGWPWMRYIILFIGLLQFAAGLWILVTVNGMAKDLFVNKRFLQLTPTETRRLAETQPVNGKQLDTSFDLAVSEARLTSVMAMVYTGVYLVSLVSLAVGCCLITFALARWNIHRQERILITLLREKCAAELAPPAEEVRDAQD